MSLTSKIAGLAIILVVATTVIFGLLVQRAAKQAITGREGDRLIFGVSEVAKKLHEDIEKAVNHAEVSAASAAVQGLVRSMENGGIDPIDGVTTAEWRQRIADNFKALLSKEKSYLSMAIIGAADNGREVVKVVRDKDGKIRIDTDNLRQHIKQNFFQNAMRQPPGTPHISEIMPQDSGGPLVVDVAAPISAPREQKFGILMLSVDCSLLIAPARACGTTASSIRSTPA
jgi:hypothetical protein